MAMWDVASSDEVDADIVDIVDVMLLWPEQTRSDDGIFDNSCVTTLQSWTLDTGYWIHNDQSPSNNVLVI